MFIVNENKADEFKKHTNPEDLKWILEHAEEFKNNQEF